MTYEFEQIGEFTREYTIPLDPVAFEEKSQGITNETASNVQLKGFRRGKAPRNLIKQRFQKEIETDVVNELVRDSVRSVIEDPEVAVLWMGEPTETKDSDEAHRVYKLRVETRPPVNLPNFEDLSVTQTEVTISSETGKFLFDEYREALIDWYPLSGDDIVAKVGDRVRVSLLYSRKVDAEGENPEEEPRMEELELGELTVILRSPGMGDIESDENPNIASLRKFLEGRRIDERVYVPKDLLAKHIASAPEIADVEEVPADIKGIDAGDMPVADGSLLGYQAIRELVLNEEHATLPSTLNQMRERARKMLEENVAAQTQTVNDLRIRQALTKSSITALPRQWIRRAFIDRLHAQVSEEEALLTFIGMMNFDRIVDAANDGDDTWAEFVQETAENPGLERIANELSQVLQGFAYALIRSAAAESLDLQPDREWVSKQIQAAAQTAERQATSTEEYHAAADQIYSEEYLEQLNQSSIDRQLLDRTLGECHIETESLEYREYIKKYSSEDNEFEIFEHVKVAAAIPIETEEETSMDSDDVDATEDQPAALTEENAESAESAELVESIVDEGESEDTGEQEEASESEAEQGTGLLRRFFGKKSN